MNRLWAFVLGVLATGCHPWRLVIGRVGRIGHGELKGLFSNNVQQRNEIVIYSMGTIITSKSTK